jgi:DNA-binding MarR family transcriptional regulator
VRTRERDYRVLAAFRSSLRALNRAIEDGARVAGLTVHQQGLLLTLRAEGGREVPLATLRAQLRIDDATMADLLARLQRRGLVHRRIAVRRDRRAADISLTRKGLTRLERSVEGIRDRIRAATDLGDLESLRSDIDEYFRFYVAGGARARRPAHPGRIARTRRS